MLVVKCVAVAPRCLDCNFGFAVKWVAIKTVKKESKKRGWGKGRQVSANKNFKNIPLPYPPWISCRYILRMAGNSNR